MQDSYSKIFGEKQRIMFVFAHPDDAEIYCGGLIARLASDKKQLKLIKMTTGNKGSRGESISDADLAKTRETEDGAALKTLGLSETDSLNLNLGDGEIENNLETIGLLVKEIRTFKPDLIVTHNPEKTLIRDLEGGYYVNHRDHRHTAEVTVDAAYPYSRDLLFYPEHIKAGLSGHTCSEFLFVDSWGHEDTVFFDITDFATTRTQAIACHKSQYSEEHAQGSTDFFAPLVEGRRHEQFRYVLAD